MPWSRTRDTPAVPSARPLVPYRDFAVEYPPGFFLWALPPALITDDIDGYRLLFTLWMAALMTAALWLTMRIARRFGASTNGDRGAWCGRGLRSRRGGHPPLRRGDRAPHYS